MARRTYSDYSATVTHTLGATPATGVSAQQIVDDALNHLKHFHPWWWRGPETTSLSIVGGQEYVWLPTDFDELCADPTYPTSLFGPMEATPLAEIESLRATEPTITAGSQWNYRYAIRPGALDRTVSPQTPRSRIELWPTPQSSVAGAIRVTYWRNVPDISGTDTPQIPPEFDAPFFYLVRAFARTSEDGAENTPDYRMFERLIAPLIAKSGGKQRNQGQIMGGAAMLVADGSRWGDHTPMNTIPDP